MQVAAKETSCCDSVLYGGGACDLECLTEGQCASQVAQTCIHDCQLKCPSLQMAPSQECTRQCLAKDAPCRKYVACRPPMQSTFTCDDGRWPQANSGCCIDPETHLVGCPKLCESERIWRLDRMEGTPWWARRHEGRGIVAQCTCANCPSSEVSAAQKLKKTMEEDLWDNGQIMLVDIARRQGLRYGPNRPMQELMATRNERILETLKMNMSSTSLDRRIAAINEHYHREILRAAQEGPDEPPRKGRRKGDDDDDDETTVVVLVTCTAVILVVVAVATCIIVRHRRKQNDGISTFQGEHVVVGNPVAPGISMDVATGAIQGGTPVTVAAPAKQSKT